MQREVCTYVLVYNREEVDVTRTQNMFGPQLVSSSFLLTYAGRLSVVNVIGWPFFEGYKVSDLFTYIIGGWWVRPSNWATNTVITALGIATITYGVWTYSASLEVRTLAFTCVMKECSFVTTILIALLTETRHPARQTDSINAGVCFDVI